ncbi:MAG: hypothetical protein JST58_18530 [Bacteroidetes bacterium]|nr:hypothetical protein [Bacteroidota bacterium]
MRQPIFGLFLFTFFITSCKKNGSSPSPLPPPGNSGTVYAVGYESNGTVTVAKYWKDNVAVNLTDGTKNAQATGIFISGNDVYISGFEVNSNGIDVAKYWKNGQAVILSDGTNNEIAYGIAVSGNDVFVLGTIFSNNGSTRKVREWVNGVGYTGNLDLTNNNTGIDSYALTVSNGIFSAAGISNNNDGSTSAIYWSHTLPFAWIAPTTITTGTAFGIAASGSDVYICGSVKSQTAPFYNTMAYYWKGNLPFPLTDGTKGAGAFGICLSGTDVYVCGYEQTGPSSGSYPQIAKYWKNGTARALGNGSISTYGRSIFVSNSDIYVCGGDSYKVGSTTYNHGYLWKNGAVIDSTVNNGQMVAVAVAQ